jgi:hypothetical protein
VSLLLLRFFFMISTSILLPLVCGLHSLLSLLWSLNLFMWVRVCVSAFDAPHPLSMLCSKIKPRKGEEKKSFSFCNLLQGWYRGRSITVWFKRSLLDSRLAINFFFLYSYHYMFFFFFSRTTSNKGKERKGKETFAFAGH